MSDTPRRDAFSRDWDWYNFHDEALTFAKKLERELEYTKFLAQERLEDAQKARREVAELREVVQELADCEMPEIAWFRKLQGRARDALEAKPHAQGDSQ